MLIELKNGRRKDFPELIGRVLIKRGLGREVADTMPAYVYETRMMQTAPYGLKSDGTPRKRPGRKAE